MTVLLALLVGLVSGFALGWAFKPAKAKRVDRAPVHAHKHERDRGSLDSNPEGETFLLYFGNELEYEITWNKPHVPRTYVYGGKTYHRHSRRGEGPWRFYR